MDRRGEYQNFLHYFHARFGFTQPPSYEEWYYNMFGINIRQNVQSLRNVQNFQEAIKLVKESVGSSFDDANIKEKPTTTRALWTQPEEKLLIQTWSENFNKLQTIKKTKRGRESCQQFQRLG